MAGSTTFTFATTDVDRALTFYVDVLAGELLARWPAGAYVLMGSLWLALVEGPAESRTADDYSYVAFGVAAHDFAALAARITAATSELWQDNWTEGEALYWASPETVEAW